MKSLTKLAAILAFVPVVAVSGSAIAGSPGQLAGGDNYLVKNLTKNGSYSNNITATCNDEIEYSMQLSNTQFGALNNVTLKATLPSAGGQSTATATTDLGGTSGTSDTATVNLGSNETQALESGTTVLYDGNGNAIKTLSDSITSGVNIGTLAGSTTEYVNFKVKISCPQPQQPVYICNDLQLTAGDNRTVKISAFSTTAQNGAVFKNAVVTWGDNSAALTTANVVGQSHQYGADGTYTVAATAHFTVNGEDVTAGGPQCSKQITFKGNTPPVITPPSTPPATPAAPTALVNTGPGSVIAIFAVATAAGTFLYRRMLTRRLSRG
jgi:hypothetical protein